MKSARRPNLANISMHHNQVNGDLKSAQKYLAALREISSLPCEELTYREREIAKHLKNQRRAVHADKPEFKSRRGRQNFPG